MNALNSNELRNALAARYGWGPEQMQQLESTPYHASTVTPNPFGVNFMTRGVADALRRDALRRQLAARSAARGGPGWLTDIPEEGFLSMLRMLP